MSAMATPRTRIALLYVQWRRRALRILPNAIEDMRDWVYRRRLAKCLGHVSAWDFIRIYRRHA